MWHENTAVEIDWPSCVCYCVLQQEEMSAVRRLSQDMTKEASENSQCRAVLGSLFAAMALVGVLVLDCHPHPIFLLYICFGCCACAPV